MNIWNVDNSNYTTLLLWRTEKDVFRVIQDGKYKSILHNGNYTLIDNKYEDVFLIAYDKLTIQRVTIQDYQFNTVVENYIELKFLNKITPETIRTEEDHGYKVWGFNGHIFVSQELKDELAKFAKKDLRFSLGFSRFAGASY